MSGLIFETIKKIQSIDKKELNHTLKDLLISILIRLGENGYIWADNTQIGAWINENPEYVKNLLSKLKFKEYLKMEGRKGQRKIYPGLKFIRYWDSIENNVRDSQSRKDDVRDSQSRTEPIPIKRTYKRKNNSVAAAVSYETEKALKTIRPGERITPDIIAMVERGIKSLGIEITKDIILYVNDRANENYGGYLRRALKNKWTLPEKREPNYIEITNNMKELEIKCCKCFNGNLKKPIDQRCNTVWGDTAPSAICIKNCPGVIRKSIDITGNYP